MGKCLSEMVLHGDWASLEGVVYEKNALSLVTDCDTFNLRDIRLHSGHETTVADTTHATGARQGYRIAPQGR